jgi:hypothetical protein
MKIFKIVAVTLLVLLTTSCVKLDMDLQVNSDSTISGVVIFALSDALDELAQDDSSQTPSSDLFDTKADGVTTESYEQDGFKGKKYILDRVPTSAFAGTEGNSSELSVAREGNLVTLNGNLDLSSDSGNNDSEADAGIFGDAFAAAITKTLFSTAELRIRVKFPAEVVSTTGELSPDRRTVTWKPKIGEKLDLKTVVKIPSAPIGLFVGVGVLLILSILGFILLKRNKRSKTIDIEPEE